MQGQNAPRQQARAVRRYQDPEVWLYDTTEIGLFGRSVHHGTVRPSERHQTGRCRHKDKAVDDCDGVYGKRIVGRLPEGIPISPLSSDILRSKFQKDYFIRFKGIGVSPIC